MHVWRTREDAILNSWLSGQKEHDVELTPTFIVNGNKHVGITDPAEWRQILDPLIAAVQG